ncbi:MAG: tetratricopeptide repeat protein [Alicyclobacillaceae bacterium]|nr:tetratricopeptide repeat protein [Alicyclobacillaceae bacterium]
MWDCDWNVGLAHFQRGNYFAARDCWRQAARTARDARQRALALNGLGAVYHRIQGAESARAYFEQALEECQSLSPDEPVRIRCLANLSQIMVRLGLTDVALRFAQEACRWLSPSQPYESAVALEVYMYALIRGDVHQEVLRLADRCREVVSWLDEDASREHLALVTHNLGYAALALGRYGEALRWYEQAYRLRPTPETVEELARVHLFRGELEPALRYAGGLPDAVWQFAIFNEKAELAYSATLIAALAYCADQWDVYERFLEKAELYFGQLSLWSEWSRTREFASMLQRLNIHLPGGAMNWHPWYALWDDLSLMDSLEAMFPRLYLLGRVATDVAVRLWDRLRGSGRTDLLRSLQVAGRLFYLGLTVQTADENEARALLQDPGGREQMHRLAVRLLEAYPHATAYRKILERVAPAHDGTGSGWQGASGRGPSAADADERSAAACLELAFGYVERVEVEGLAHAEAVAEVGRWARSWCDGAVLGAFLAELADSA